MNWFILQITDDTADLNTILPRHSCFVLRNCTELWKTNHVIVDELAARGYLNCCLMQCTEEEMLTISDNTVLRRRRDHKMGPYECMQLTQEQMDQLLLLLHISDRYQVVRCMLPTEEQKQEKPGEVKRGLLRGLKGSVVSDRANLRKFIPVETLIGVHLMILMPAPELRPLTKVEYESMRLRIDTSAKWYLVLCKNERTLQQAFRMNPRMRTQEGIFTEDLSLVEFHSDMAFPQGISQKRYFYHVGSPFPKHYFFVFTTLADVQGCRVRNPYARIGLVWNRGYEPVALREKDFKQLVYSVEGKQQEISAYMQKFIDGLKTGDKLGFFLTNLQEIPTPAKLLRKKKNKLVVQTDEGITYTVGPEKVVPPRKEKE